MDALIDAKKADLKNVLLGVMDDEKIRLREEVQEQIRWGARTADCREYWRACSGAYAWVCRLRGTGFRAPPLGMQQSRACHWVLQHNAVQGA